MHVLRFRHERGRLCPVCTNLIAGTALCVCDFAQACFVQREALHPLKASAQIVSVYAGCKQIELALQPYGRETNHAVEP